MGENRMIIERIIAPIHHYTFQSIKIKAWVEKYCEGYTLNLFAGKTILDVPGKELRIDLDPDCVVHKCMDAFDFVKHCGYINKFGTILLDPPYSERKSIEYYNGKKVSRFTKILDLLSTLLKDNGIVITFGYQSVIMGKKRGFKVERVCLFSHGGAIHDTIATIERKIK
jgi:hypothetical protein